MKYFLVILTILFTTLSLCLFYDLVRPIKETTKAIEKKFEFQDVRAIEFFTDYDAPYKFFLEIRRSQKDLDTSGVKVSFLRNETVLLDTVYTGLDSYLSIRRSFIAKSGDRCTIELLDKVDKSSIKQVYVLGDVNSGGPSVGIAYAKTMRPYLWGVLAFLVLFSIISGYLGYEK